MVNFGILYSRIKYRFRGTFPTIQAALYTDITPRGSIFCSRGVFFFTLINRSAKVFNVSNSVQQRNALRRIFFVTVTIVRQP